MVWEDAPLYVSPDEEAGFARLRPTEHVAGHGGYLPLEILEDQGDWIKVQPAAGDSCHSAPDSRLSSVSLDLYVQRGDLLYVTPATVSVDYDDGSHFELQPGVVVSPPEGRLLVGQGELLMTADAGDIVADVTLPEGSLGLAFPATVTRKLPAEQLQQVVTSSNRSLGETLGGEVYWLGVGPAYLQGSWELPADPDLDEADSEVVEENYVGDSSDRPDVGQAQGIVHGQCSVHHFQMLPSRIKPSDYVPNEGVGEEGVSTNSGSEGPQWTIAADTALNWSDGSQAGTTTEPVTLHGELSFEDRKTRCGHLLLDSSPVPATDGVSYEVDPSGAFEVCAERRAVTRK